MSAVSVKKETHEETKIKIEDSLIVEDLKEDESPVYVRLKHESKETEDKSHGKKATQTKDEKTIHDIFENNINQGKKNK